MLQDTIVASPHSSRGSSVFQVAAGSDFTSLIVEYAMRHWPREQWADALILLPGKRSVRQVREAFLNHIGQGSALLPTLLPLADIEPADLLLLQSVRSEHPPVPVMHGSERRLLLARQVMKRMQAEERACSMRYALEMADALGHVFDEAVRYGVDARKLRYLVPDNLSAHWQQSLVFLSIVFEHWPRIEASYGRQSYQAALVQALERVAQQWETTPPDFPVMVAGSTGSQPSTARLMCVVADMPMGVVLLPSASVDKVYAEHISSGHPLYHVHAFIRSNEVESWFLGDTAPHANAAYIARLFRPLGAGDMAMEPMPETLVPITCADEWEEARVIGLIVRERLAGKGTVGVVSPDRATLARVGVLLRRWGIVAESSSASRLYQHGFVRWMIALLHLVDSGGGALESLAFFQHPLTFAAHPALAARMQSNLETRYARGLAGQRSLQAMVRSVLYTLPPEDEGRAHAFTQALLSFARMQVRRVSMREWLDKLRQCAGLCGADAAIDEAIDTLFALLEEQDESITLNAEEALLLVEHAADTPWFSDKEGRPHPSVFLHTPIEARLQRFDCVILAGLNEDVWPRLSSGPWLNQAMRRQLGLPTYEHELSLQSHDFMECASQKLVFLTRPERVAQAVMTPSRWWQRIVCLQPAESPGDYHRHMAERYVQWAQHMDAAEQYAPAPPPRPNPPPMLRPRQLRATQMADLLENPYAVYARSMLHLEPLEPIDREPDARLMGLLMHALLERAGGNSLAIANEEMIRLIDAVLERYAQNGRVQIFWRARLLRGLRFFVGQHQRRLPRISRVESEWPLSFSLPVGEAAVSFNGRADRVEFLTNGETVVVDFKTGGQFPASRLVEGELPQLVLYRMAVSQRDYGERFAAHLGDARLSYWLMPHGDHPGEVRETPVLTNEQMQEILRRYQNVAGYYLMEQHAMLYAPSMTAGRYAYSALARAAEWGGPDSPEAD